MASVEYELLIRAPVDTVYSVSQDYAVRYEWDPFPDKIELLEGVTHIEKGTKVFVRAKNGLKMMVEFVQVLPPTTTAIKMVVGPFFLKSFAGSWVFKKEEHNFTEAKFKYTFKMKAWTIPFVSEFIALRYFSFVVNRRLNGLKYYCEGYAKPKR